MLKLRLSDEDRKKLGGPEWLEFENQLSTREAEAIETAGADFGALVTFNTRPTTAAWRQAVWLSLARAGVNVPYEDVHFNLLALDVEVVKTGKAPSARSGSRTRPASAATSTPRSRRKA